MLAQRMGKTRVIAETGAGQHGVATATACALFGIECTVYMGEEDIRRQKLNVFNMRTLGATVVPVTTGSRTLRDATNEAMRDWMGSSRTTHYTIGSVVGPHPFPMIVRDFQSVIGRETTAAVPRAGRAGCPTRSWPASAAARTRPGCSTRSSTTLEVELVGAEAGGRGPQAGEHAASLSQGPARRAARQLQLCAPGRGRPDARRPLDLGRARLSGRRARAQLLEGNSAAARYEIDHRRRSARRLQHHRPPRRDPPGPGIEPCPGPGLQGSRPSRAGQGRSSSACRVAATRMRTRSRGCGVKTSRDRPLRTGSHEPHRRACFPGSAAENRRALMPFVTAGDPDLPTTAMLDLRAGCRRRGSGRDRHSVFRPGRGWTGDRRELPPGARSGREDRSHLPDTLRMLRAEETARFHETPLVAMVSFAIVHRVGAERFLDEAAGSGLDGLIVPDLPVEESAELRQQTSVRGLKLIQLITPTTPRERAVEIARATTGFVYYVSVAGITGERKALPEQVVEEVAWLRTQTDLPICIGFGISSPEQVRQLAPVADGLIVGSAIVRRLSEAINRPRGEVVREIGQFVAELSRAL